MIDTIDTLIKLGMVRDGLNTLDVGCGGGNWAEDFIARGYKLNYIGLDCQRACYVKFRDQVKDTNYKFILLDAYNSTYNPDGHTKSSDVVFPIGDRCVDLVICHSLFTHLGKYSNAVHYMNEIKRCMKPGGKLWITFFKSPPNKPCVNPKRTVYSEEEIKILMEGFSFIYEEGGLTDEFHDQLMIGARYENIS